MLTPLEPLADHLQALSLCCWPCGDPRCLLSCGVTPLWLGDHRLVDDTPALSSCWGTSGLPVGWLQSLRSGKGTQPRWDTPSTLWRAVEMGTRDVLSPRWVSGGITPGVAPRGGGQWSVLTWLQAQGAQSPKSSDP